MAGVIGAGKPPFSIVTYCGFDKSSTMVAGTSSRKVNAGNQVVGRRLHDHVEEDVSHHGGDAHLPCPTTPPP